MTFACLWLLVSSIIFLFANPAHLKISSPAWFFCWIVVICLLLWIAYHTSVWISPWVRFFWKTFYIAYLFCFFIFLFFSKYTYPEGSWWQDLVLQFLHMQQPGGALGWIFQCFGVTGGFTISPLGCNVENLQYFFPWLIRLLVASKLWPWWLRKSDYDLWIMLGLEL